MLDRWGDHLVQLGTASTLAEGKAAQGHGMRFSEYVRLMDWYVGLDPILQCSVFRMVHWDGAFKERGYDASDLMR